MRQGSSLKMIAIAALVLSAVAIRNQVTAANEPNSTPSPALDRDQLVAIYPALSDPQQLEVPVEMAETPVEPYDPIASLSAGAERYVLPPNELAVLELLQQTDLPEHRIDELMTLAEPAVALVPRGSRADASDGGRSQVGGHPLLPRSYPWPMAGAEPLSLVAQIDLDALPDRADLMLPKDGLLQFYMNLDFDAGLNGPFEGAAHVLWFQNTAGFVHRVDGTAAWGDFAIEIDHVEFMSLPNPHATLPLRHWSQEERDVYGGYAAAAGTCDQLAGWSSEFDNDTRIPAALDQAGLSFNEVIDQAPPGPGGFGDALVAKTDVDRWTLLLELCMTPSTDGEGMWGDAGDITWVIDREDLERLDVSEVWWEFAG